MKQKIIYILICLLSFSSIAQTQKVVLDANFSMDVNKVTYKKTITATLQVVVAKSKHKFISIDVVFHSKSSKREQLPLEEMKFVSNNNEYKVIMQQGLGAYSSVSGQYLKFKKKKKTTLYIEVKNDTKKGVLYYKGQEIGKIIVSQDSKEGQFNIVN